MDERETALKTLVGLISGGDKSQMNPDHIKGSAVLGNRDTSVYSGVEILHLKKWMDEYEACTADVKVNAFVTCWGWCDAQEKKMTMAGLT